MLYQIFNLLEKNIEKFQANKNKIETLTKANVISNHQKIKIESL